MSQPQTLLHRQAAFKVNMAPGLPGTILSIACCSLGFSTIPWGVPVFAPQVRGGHSSLLAAWDRDGLFDTCSCGAALPTGELLTPPQCKQQTHLCPENPNILNKTAPHRVLPSTKTANY